MKIYQLNNSRHDKKIFWFLDYNEGMSLSISLYHITSSNSRTATKGLGFRIL